MVSNRERAVKKMMSHLARVGEIASLWSLLEFHMDAMIWKLLGVEQQLGACVTSQIISAPAKLRTIRALLDSLNADESYTREVNKFGGLLTNMQIERSGPEWWCSSAIAKPPARAPSIAP
jgi:hypothetical protein